jgi:hypothetical protein
MGPMRPARGTQPNGQRHTMPGCVFITMNRSTATREVFANLTGVPAR